MRACVRECQFAPSCVLDRSIDRQCPVVSSPIFCAEKNPPFVAPPHTYAHLPAEIVLGACTPTDSLEHRVGLKADTPRGGGTVGSGTAAWRDHDHDYDHNRRRAR